jgi:cyclophilin family peptidyl-prolyl cis-trans isomerase
MCSSFELDESGLPLAGYECVIGGVGVIGGGLCNVSGGVVSSGAGDVGSKSSSSPLVKASGSSVSGDMASVVSRSGGKSLKENAATAERSRVWLDVEYINVDGSVSVRQRVVIELFDDIVPKTARNFRLLCIGEKGLCLSGSEFHRVVKGQCVQGGRLGPKNESVYGGLFEDESFEVGHDRGVLSMANAGRDGNGSQFFVCLKRVKSWDGKHVVFGRVLSGMRVFDRMSEDVEVEGSAHLVKSGYVCRIVGSGVVENQGGKSVVSVREGVSLSVAALPVSSSVVAGLGAGSSSIVLTSTPASESTSASLAPSSSVRSSSGMSGSVTDSSISGGGWGGVGFMSAGGWQCDTCLVLNGSDVSKCVSCGCVKKGDGGGNEVSLGMPGSGVGSSGSVLQFGIGNVISDKSSAESKASSAFGFGSLSWLSSGSGGGTGLVFGMGSGSTTSSSVGSIGSSVITATSVVSSAPVNVLKSNSSFQFGSGFGGVNSVNSGVSVGGRTDVCDGTAGVSPAVVVAPMSSVGASVLGGNGLWFDVGLDSPDGGCVGLSGRVTMDLSDALDGVLRAKVLERSVKGDFLVGCRVTRVVVGGQVDLGCVSCVGGVREALESCCSVRSDDGGVKLSRGSVWLCVDGEKGVRVSIIVGGNVDVKGVGCLIGVVRSGLRVSVCVAVVFCSMMSFVVVCSVSVC